MAVSDGPDVAFCRALRADDLPAMQAARVRSIREGARALGATRARSFEMIADIETDGTLLVTRRYAGLRSTDPDGWRLPVRSRVVRGGSGYVELVSADGGKVNQNGQGLIVTPSEALSDPNDVEIVTRLHRAYLPASSLEVERDRAAGIVQILRVPLRHVVGRFRVELRFPRESWYRPHWLDPLARDTVTGDTLDLADAGEQYRWRATDTIGVLTVIRPAPGCEFSLLWR